MNIFQIPPGFSSYYQGFWNDKTKTFNKGSDIDVFNECSKQCYNETCYNDRCSKMKKYCVDNCYLYPQSRKTMSDCARDNTCGRFPNFNRQCLLENKDTLLKCCNRYCNTNITDCDKDCKGFYKLLLNNNSNPTNILKNNSQSISHKNRHMYSIFIIFLFSITILILIKMKKKNK